MENCARCALALELRRRGFDVEATPHLDKFSDWDMIEGEGFLMSFVGIGKNTVCIESKPTQKNIDSAIEKMVENGDGSRYLISVRRKYNRAGHAFNCEVVKGRAVFVDPQSGEVGDGALSVLKDNSCKDFTIRRVDNLETVNEVICMAANERGLNDD